MFSTERLHRYQSAVYLNNTAVTFMSQGEYGKAMETLSDALVLIKSLVQLVESSLSVRKAEIFAQIKVQKTQRTLARLPIKPRDSEGAASLNIVYFDGSLNANVLLRDSDNEDENDWYTGAAVLMNDVSLTDSEDMAICVQCIAPTIILSNFALSHFYASSHWALCEQEDFARENLIHGALRMLDIGQAVLGLQDLSMDVNEGNMFLAMVLVNNTCCVQQQSASGQLSDALSRSSQELESLKQLSNQMDLTRSFPPVAGAA